MDVSSIASLATTMAETGVKQEVDVAVLKKALDVQGTSALALIQAVPGVSASANLPPHLGQNVNTTA